MNHTSIVIGSTNRKVFLISMKTYSMKMNIRFWDTSVQKRTEVPQFRACGTSVHVPLFENFKVKCLGPLYYISVYSTVQFTLLRLLLADQSSESSLIFLFTLKIVMYKHSRTQCIIIYHFVSQFRRV